MLEKVLVRIPTKDLLVCRSVCKSWTQVTTSLCHNRHVSLKNGWSRQLNTVSTIFKPESIPWSTFHFLDLKRLKKDPPSHGRGYRFDTLSVAALETFMGFYRVKLLKLHITVECEELVNLLKLTPNIQILELGFGYKPIASQQISKQSEDALYIHNLKLLKLHLFDSDDDDDETGEEDLQCRELEQLRLVEVIINATRKLEAVNVTFYDLTRAVTAEKFGTLLVARNVPILNMDFRENTFPAQPLTILASKKLKIRALMLEVSEPLEGLEQLVASSSQFLEELSLNCMYDRQELNETFLFPSMPALREFNFESNDVDENAPQTSFLFMLHHNLVPNLTTVTFYIPLFSGKFSLFNPACCFEKVAVLIMARFSSETHLQDDFFRLFPNVKTLKLADGGDEREFKGYAWKMLEHLDIETFRETEGELGELLSGRPEGQVGTEPQPQSLFSLTELKTLELNAEEGIFLSDNSVAVQCLLNIHVLDSLSLVGIKISTACKESLEKRHRNLVLSNF